MVKRRFNITLCMMFMLGMLGMHYAHAGEITIPEGYSLDINDGMLNLPEESINNAGTLQVGTGAIKLGGNWTNTGTFIPGTGNVELIGTTGQTISGANTFYNFICTSAGNQLFFEAGKTQTITANWMAMGNAGSYLVLRSTVNGTQWYVDPAGTRNVSYVEVKNSVNSSIPPINPAVWTDQGNNVNWIAKQTNPATLVAQWEFDGDFTAANDSNYNGNPSGTVTFVSGKVGQAARFDGGEAIGSYNTTIDYVDSQKTTPVSEFNGGFSVMGWIKPEDQVSGYFLDHDESCCTTSAFGFGAVVGSQGTVHLTLRDSSDRRIFGESPVGAVPAGTWSHVALTWNGSTSGGIKIYVNGQETTTNIWFLGAFSGLNGTAPLSLRIGSTHANSLNTIRGYVGSIDHISVWEGVLTPEEILADYNEGASTTINTTPVANAGPDQSVYVINMATLDGSGSSNVDGDTLTYIWSLTSKPQGSTATLSNPSAVSPTFTVDKPGTYVASLTVNDGTVNSSPDTVSITTLNSAPVANSGPDQSVYVTNTVALDGSGSSDVDGDTLTYSWTISSKPENSTAALTNATSVSPAFTADKFGTYVVSLTVNDGTVNSVADTVTITTLNSAPVADAGADQSTYVSNTVTLDGSGSSDVDGDTLAYSWTFASRPENSVAVLTNATSVSPTFTADKFGTYVISLTVNDGTVNSVADTVTITTSNSAPVANAGPDQTPYVNETVTLNGGGSTDVDGDLLTYTWTFTSRPANSSATLSDVHAVNPTFTVDKAGTYVVSLVVNDGTVNSPQDTVTISTLNSAPVANAGADQSPYVTEVVTLNGAGSTDVDGDLLTYTWTFTTKPTGSGATLSDLHAVNPIFTVDKAGTYVVSLMVNDGTVNSNQSDTVTISTLNSAPVANAGPDQSPHVTETVTLDGSGSTDVDGDLLTYTWAFTARPQDSNAELNDVHAVNPTFTVDKAGTYVVSLMVNDGAVDSNQADTVTISTLNSAPVAVAGPDQSPYVTETVTLNGAGSSDVDGDLLTYTWAFTAKPAGSTATLSDSNAVNPTFTVDKAGTYVVSLIVNDGTVDSNQPDTVTISTLNSAPVAVAGPDQSPHVTETVTLDGSGSTDVDGDLLTYTWAFTARPQDSNAELNDVHAVNPTFTVDKAGTYVVSLMVNDGTVDSNQPHTVTISTLNSAPVAVAGPDQSPHVTDVVTLNGAGSTDVDGDLLTYTWAFTARPQDSNAELSDVHAVNPTFTVDKAGTYVVSLIVNDGAVDSNQPETVTISTLNSAPVAVAGPDQSPHVTDVVTLNGAGSTDVDGDLLTYTWAFTVRPQDSNAELNDVHAVNPTFTVDKAGTYVVSLIVNDSTVDSQPDTVMISTLNSAPVADAGDGQSPHVTDVVTLNGSGSTDVDGDLLTYTWAFTVRPQDSTATLSDPHAVSPTFTVDKAGTYVVSLIVNDGTVDSAPDTVTISTLNSAPVANAGADQMVYVNDPVTLDGSGSTDVDGDLLIYTWAFTAKPQDSNAKLDDVNAVNPTFTVDKAGTYVVSLVVNDGTVDSLLDTVTITTTDSMPTAIAGQDQSAYVNDTVTLDGSNSFDVDGSELTFSWAFTSKPSGSTAALSDQDTVNPTFTIDKAGTYVVSLIVNDGTMDSDPDTVTITTKNSKPVANAGTDQSIVLIGTTVQLDGSQSFDLDGDDITYQWAFTSKPVGSNASLVNSDTVTPTFVADVRGDYVIQLIVMDAILQSTPDTVIVNFTNIKPVADAGMSQSVYIGDTVTLDGSGSGSTDANGDTLSYDWTLTSVPAGSSAAVTDPTAGVTSFVPDVTGTYMVQLVVNDGTVDSDPDTILIQVSSEQTAAIEAVKECITQVSLLNRRAFMCILLKEIMINRFNRVIANIEAGRYTWALWQLQTEIRFTDGCAKSGKPDRIDWITTCEAQGMVYPSILVAIDAVEALMQ